MVLTRGHRGALQALAAALAAGDEGLALSIVERHRLAACSLSIPQAEATLLHLAALGDCPALMPLLAHSEDVDGVVAPPDEEGAWVPDPLLASTCGAQHDALVPGSTALAVASRVGHLASVQRLLELGADPNLVGPEAPDCPKPFTPLSAAVLTPGTAARPATRSIVAALLAAGADPLAPSVRRRCSALRCACGSEFLANGSLPLLLDHLEGQRRRGRLALGSGDAAAEVMVAAARSGRAQLFAVAHEFVMAAAGLRLRRRQEATAAAAARAAARRAVDSSSSSSEGAAAPGLGAGPSRAGGAAAANSSDGSDADSGLAPPPRAPRWQPSAVQLLEALRGAALGGCLAVLRAVLASPLPFSVAATDAAGNGLLAHCAAHGGSPEALRLLHGAGAQLTLRRLLYVLERTMDAAPLAALLACPRPRVPLDAATVKAAGRVSFSCPIHRLLHIWKRGSHPAREADPAGWPRRVLAAMEALVAAGYRPAVYRGLSQPLLMLTAQGDRLAPAGDPLDPFDFYPESGPADSRLLLVARQGSWDAATHRIWPDRFKAAVRALLLAAHRQARGGGAGGGRASRAARAVRRAGGGALRREAGTGAGLAALPGELLLRIAGEAAWPLSAWL